MSQQIKVAACGDIPPNSMRAFAVANRRVLIINYEGNLHALDELCPHLAVPMSKGELKEGCLVCPGHGSVFALDSGTPTRWLGKPITWLTRLSQGKPINAHTFKVWEQDGQIIVEV